MVAATAQCGALPHRGAGVKRLQVKGIVVEHCTGLWVGGEEDLKAAVEEKAVDGVGTDTTTDVVSSLVQLYSQACLGKCAGCGEASHTGPNDDDIGGGGGGWGAGVAGTRDKGCAATVDGPCCWCWAAGWHRAGHCRHRGQIRKMPLTGERREYDVLADVL